MNKKRPPRKKKQPGTPRPGNGGARQGAGRKTKAEEDKIRKLGLDAIRKVYGSEPAFWKKLVQESENSFPHKKLLMEYVYGKPKETVDIDVREKVGIPVTSWADDE